MAALSTNAINACNLIDCRFVSPLKGVKIKILATCLCLWVCVCVWAPKYKLIDGCHSLRHSHSNNKFVKKLKNSIAVNAPYGQTTYD